MNKSGRPTYLGQGEESLIVEISEIEDVHGLTLDCRDVSERLQRIIKAFKCRCGENDINKKPPLNYFRKLIKHVNGREDGNEIQKINSHTGLAKASSCSNNRSMQSDNRLYLIMLHSIDAIHSDMKHQ